MPYSNRHALGIESPIITKGTKYHEGIRWCGSAPNAFADLPVS